MPNLRVLIIMWILWRVRVKQLFGETAPNVKFR
jgi:hypothetical protein